MVTPLEKETDFLVIVISLGGVSFHINSSQMCRGSFSHDVVCFIKIVFVRQYSILLPVLKVTGKTIEQRNLINVTQPCTIKKRNDSSGNTKNKS